MRTVEDIPDQRGRVAVVTGANGGLGLATATALAGKGAHVVMAARNQAKATAARVRSYAHPDAALEVVELDLGRWTPSPAPPARSCSSIRASTC